MFVLGLAQESVHMYLNYIGSVVSDKPARVEKIAEDVSLTRRIINAQYRQVTQFNTNIFCKSAEDLVSDII